MLDAATLRQVIAIAEARSVNVLVDETYRDMAFGPQPPVAASLSPSAISVSSVSKTYGIPGVRWLDRLRDAALMTRFLAAKEQIGICGSVIDERLAQAALAQGETWLSSLQARLREGFATIEAWMAGEPRLEWVKPAGGCVCFPGFGRTCPSTWRSSTASCWTTTPPWSDRPLVRNGPAVHAHRLRLALADELAGGLAAISASLDAAVGAAETLVLPACARDAHISIWSFSRTEGPFDLGLLPRGEGGPKGRMRGRAGGWRFISRP